MISHCFILFNVHHSAQHSDARGAHGWFQPLVFVIPHLIWSMGQYAETLVYHFKTDADKHRLSFYLIKEAANVGSSLLTQLDWTSFNFVLFLLCRRLLKRKRCLSRGLNEMITLTGVSQICLFPFSSKSSLSHTVWKSHRSPLAHVNLCDFQLKIPKKSWTCPQMSRCVSLFHLFTPSSYL